MNKVKSTHNLIMGLFLLAFSMPFTAFERVSEAQEKGNNKILIAGKQENTNKPEKGVSAEIAYKEVNRIEVLEAFFEKYDSPMTEEAETFVRVADEKGLDYRLLPAISCMESTCGHFLLPDTYNAWGWGIYGNNVIAFSSWEEGIETVGEGIAENYAARGLDTPEKMAPVYTPPNSVNWRNGVRFFMNQMDEIAMDS